MYNAADYAGETMEMEYLDALRVEGDDYETRMESFQEGRVSYRAACAGGTEYDFEMRASADAEAAAANQQRLNSLVMAAFAQGVRTERRAA